MTYYFFHHPLVSLDGIPGRYAFRASGTLVDLDGNTQYATFRVPADGLADDRPGPNIDPCPFASPVAMIHSFCRIDRRGGKYYVPNTRGVLSELVEPGDTILYGHLRTQNGAPHTLFVDSVLIVADTVILPTERVSSSRFRFVCDHQMMARVLDPAGESGASTSWDAFLKTDLWRLNLSDAASGGTHEFTRLEKHRVIVGASAEPSAAGVALRERRTSFVPLVDDATGRPSMISADDSQFLWSALSEWLSYNPRMSWGMKPPSRLPDALGEAMYDAVRAASGRGGPIHGSVALPPVHWVGTS